MQFKSALLSVANGNARKKFTGYRGEQPVVTDLGLTIATLILADRNRTVVTDEFMVMDYQLPTSSGLLQMASIAKVYLYESVIEVTEPVCQKSTSSVVSGWLSECADGRILTPASLKAQLQNFYKLTSGETPSFININKEHKTLKDLGYLYDGNKRVVQISETGTVDERASYLLGLSVPALARLGSPFVVSSDDILSEWMFGIGTVSNTKLAFSNEGETEERVGNESQNN